MHFTNMMSPDSKSMACGFGFAKNGALQAIQGFFYEDDPKVTSCECDDAGLDCLGFPCVYKKELVVRNDSLMATGYALSVILLMAAVGVGVLGCLDKLGPISLSRFGEVSWIWWPAIFGLSTCASVVVMASPQLNVGIDSIVPDALQVDESLTYFYIDYSLRTTFFLVPYAEVGATAVCILAVLDLFVLTMSCLGAMKITSDKLTGLHTKAAYSSVLLAPLILMSAVIAYGCAAGAMHKDSPAFAYGFWILLSFCIIRLGTSFIIPLKR